MVSAFGLSKSIKEAKKNAVIAELKVYSPKYGDLLKGRDIWDILRIYEKGGAVGISYITEPTYYRGDLNTFKKIVKETNLPVLRKDFIKSKEEIEKTAEMEASAILLIPRILKEDTGEFVDFALEHGLDTLVEVHTEEDLKIVISTNTTMVGINNRDIGKLETDDGDVSLTTKLAPMIPERFVKVSESGIYNLRDLKKALKYTSAALIGTALMKSQNPYELLKSFVEG